VARLDADAELPVLGRYGSYLYVQAPSGRRGWVDADDGAPGPAAAAGDALVTQE
jgi:hypothetical protein